MSDGNFKSPYKGLQPYTERDRNFFFGRERDQEIIASNLLASSLTIFYGASGVGKSSVLLAGVVPALRETPRVAVVVFRDWQDASFESALKTEVLKAIKADSKTSINRDLELDEFLVACTRAFRGSLFLVLDQFEEYFLYHPSTAQAEKFDAAFARAINRNEIEANFLLSMRDDGLSRLDRFQKRIPNLLNNMLRLEHLNRDSAELAIRGPLNEYNKNLANGQPRVGIDEELVKLLLDDLVTGKVTLTQTGQGKVGAEHRTDKTGRIETPFLQMVLTRLWDEELATPDQPAAQERKLRLATYRALGGATTIVRTHLDKVMETHLMRPHRKTAATLFHFLVTPTGMKIAHTVRDLISYAKQPAAEVEQALDELSKSDVRILRPVPAPPGQPELLRYEIFHDVLAPAILDWRGRYMKQQADIEAKAEAEARLAEERAEANRLAAEQQLQLDAANAQAEADRRHARVLRVTLVAILLLALGMGGVAVYAYRQKKVADEQKTEAVRQKTVADQQTLNAREQTTRAEAATEKADAATADALASKGLAEENAAKALAAKQALIETQKKITAALDRARQALAAQERALAAEKQAIEAQAQERSRREEVEALNLTLQEQIARSRVADDQSQAAGNKTLNISEIASSTTGRPTTSTSRIDAANLKRIVPSLSAERSAELGPHLQRAMDEFEINTPLRQAAFITVVGLETSALRNFEEPLNYSAARLTQVFPKYFRNIDPEPYAHQPEKIANRIYANRGGNGPEESGDGWRYRTRLVLWGRNRYREFGQALKLDLENNPDEAAKPALAFRIAAAYWKSDGYNQIADKGNIELIITKFFGPSSGGAGKAGAEYFGRAKEVLGAQ